MEEAKSGDATMEDAKPDEDPFGWGGDLDQDHQDMLNPKLPSSTDGPMDPAETYSNLLPDHEMKDSKTSGCATRTPDVLCDAVEQAGEAEGHAAAEPCAAEQARDLIFDDGAAAAYDSIADTVLELGAERPQMISDTMDVAVEMDAQTDFALVPVSSHLNRWHRLVAHVGNQGLLGVTWERNPSASRQSTFSHQFGFRDSTLWCWRCGGWSAGSRRTSRLKGPCGAPTKNGADVVYRVIWWFPS